MSFVGLATALAAQQAAPDAASITKALGGDDAIAVAWAAHHARELGDKQLAKPLQQALSTWRTNDDYDAPTVRLHVLDALVHLAPRMPAADLVPLLDDPVCGIAAFVLVAREPAHNEVALLNLFRSDQAASEVAGAEPLSQRVQLLGKLLASRNVPGFAAAVAERASLDLELPVVGAQDAMWGSITAPKLRRARPDWPTFPIYQFTDVRTGVPELSARQVAIPAPLAGAVSRVTANEPGITWATAGEAGQQRAQPAIEWLCTMAALPRRGVTRALTWTNPATLLATATAVRAERQELLDTLRQRLVANGSMTAEEAKVLGRRVQVRFVDQRNDRSIALPEIPPAR